LDQSYFESRESLEEAIIEERKREKRSECIEAPKISFKDALKAMKVDLSCNMEYYLANLNELEADLNRPIDINVIIDDKLEMRKLEQELFYKNLCKILSDGEESKDDKVEKDGDYVKTFMITDFRIFHFDGNNMYATAKRGNYYLVFIFVY
jgi:hypothetical protein